MVAITRSPSVWVAVDELDTGDLLAGGPPRARSDARRAERNPEVVIRTPAGRRQSQGRACSATGTGAPVGNCAIGRTATGHPETSAWVRQIVEPQAACELTGNA